MDETGQADQRKHGLVKVLLMLGSLLVMGVVIGHRRNGMGKEVVGTQMDLATASQDSIRGEITCGTTVTGTITPGSKVFYGLWTPLAATLTLDTCGSAFDTYLYVYNGNSQTNVHWRCDDCGPCGTRTVQTFTFTGYSNALRPNTRYTVGVGGYRTSAGTFRLKVTCKGLSISCGGTASGAIVANGRAFYTLPVPKSALSVTVSTCGSKFDTWLYMYRGVEAGANRFYSCDDCGPCGTRTVQTFVTNGYGAASTRIVGGSASTIGVGGYRASAGVFTLRVTCHTPAPTPPPVRRTTVTTSPPPTGCPPRVRRDWMDITQAERNLYMNGYKQLRANGKLAAFTETHGHNNNFWSAHRDDRFMPWHRYFIWEFEQQLRALGGVYSCVTLPYWDWTRNSGNEVNNPMFTHGLGGSGSPCVTTGLFTQNQYSVTGGGCLRRSFCSGPTCRILPFETTQGLMNNMVTRTAYTSFRPYFESTNHDEAHVFLGGQSVSGASPDDPFFFLIHTMVDFIWALWQDCHDYDRVAASALGAGTSNIYPPSGLDSAMPFSGALSSASWAQVSTRSITPRMMHSIQNGMLRYQYSTSTILTRSGVSFARCNFGSWTVRPPLMASVKPRDEGEVVAAEIDKRAGLWQRAMQGDEIAALKVAKDVSPSKQMKDDARNNKVAQLACKSSKEEEPKHGGPEPCVFDPRKVEKCGNRKGVLTLDELLNKSGVKGNACLEGIRRNMYIWCNITGCLGDLCNGMYDPTCN